ncbi:unnamed protein product [Lathyrus oleraceus]
MKYYQFYRSWMYDITYLGRCGLKPYFEEKVVAFLKCAFAQECCQSGGGVRCSCLSRNIISDPNVVKPHLEKDGFRPNY